MARLSLGVLAVLSATGDAAAAATSTKAINTCGKHNGGECKNKRQKKKTASCESVSIGGDYCGNNIVLTVNCMIGFWFSVFGGGFFFFVLIRDRLLDVNKLAADELMTCDGGRTDFYTRHAAAPAPTIRLGISQSRLCPKTDRPRRSPDDKQRTRVNTRIIRYYAMIVY